MKYTLKTKLGVIALTTLFLATSQNSFAKKQENDWIVRGRAIYVGPSTKGTASTLGGRVHASADLIPEIDVTKFITPNLAFELIAGTSKHDIKLKGSSLGSADGLGTVKLLPPTLTAQYHFNPIGNFKPYAGAGVNYTIFYGAKTGGSATNIKYQNHLGFALQAGFDYMIDEKVSLNFDVKKIYVKSHVKVNNLYSAEARLDPWLVGVGVGYHF